MTASLNAIYVHRLTKFSELSFFYKFDRHYRKTTSSLHLLDRLDGDDGLEVGQLPSASDYELAIDFSNSYKSKLYESTHQLQPFWAMKTPLKKGGVLFAQVRVPIRFLHQKLNYQRGVVDTVAVRNTTLIDADNIMLQWTSKDRSVKTNFHVEVNSKAPDILKTIDIRDDTDPMNIRLANADSFISELPLGFNTMIGMEGNGLSQGQRQRILISRAIYKNPEYIFFYEATNSLDTTNESDIMKTLLNSIVERL